MPSFPVVVEDTSPMLRFSTAAWRAGVSGDSQLDQYSESSYLLTQTDGATISFGFFGSSVQVFGSKRSYHGEYKVQVDDTPATTLNGTSNAELFNQLLFGGNFTLGNHLLQFTNVNVTFTDLDYISFQTSVGHDDEDLIVNTFQDGHPYFTYSPPAAWDTPAMVSTFIGSTGHATTTAQASANFTFQPPFKGDAVALYGPTGPSSCSSYSIKIDNENASSFSANRQFYKTQTMLFYAGNLGSGPHTLQIQIPGANSGEFAVDFATVYTTPSLGGSNVVESNTSFGLPSPVHVVSVSRTRLEKNLIAGIAVVSSASILLILAFIYVIWRQRRSTSAKSSETEKGTDVISPFTSSQPGENPTRATAVEQTNYPQSIGSRRGKLALDALPVSPNPSAASAASGSGVQRQSEPQGDMDTSVSPPHYTLSPEVDSGSSVA